MSETLTDPNARAGDWKLHRIGSSLRGWPLHTAAAFAGVAAVAWLWRLGLSHLPPGAAWLLIQFPLGICTVCLAWRFASRHERHWIRPSLELKRLIEEVRRG